MAKARIVIANKPGVFNPEGAVVMSGLKRLGYDNVGNARVGKVIELELEGDEASLLEQIDAMCAAFLVNPVIENYTVEFLDGV